MESCCGAARCTADCMKSTWPASDDWGALHSMQTATGSPLPRKKLGTFRKKLLFTARHWVARHGLGSLPEFMIIGAQRSGTTSLHHYLMDYPQMIRALMKEIHFFDYNFHRGLAWYQ